MESRSILPVELRPLVEVETRTEDMRHWDAWLAGLFPTGHVALVMGVQVSLKLTFGQVVISYLIFVLFV